MNYDNYSDFLGQIFSTGSGVIDILTIPVGASLLIKRTDLDKFEINLTPRIDQINVQLKVDLTK